MELFTPNHAGSQFTSSGAQITFCVLNFLAIALLTHCTTHRVSLDDLTLRGLKSITWLRLFLILALADSWLFVFISGVLIFGVGLETSPAICSSAIALCIAFYATSKMFVYHFLVERVKVVWVPLTGQKRFSSPMYILAFTTACLYSIVVVFAVLGKVHYFKSDGACVIGLKALASIPVLSYDLYVNVFLNVLFLWPLLRSKLPNLRMRRVAKRTLVASLISLSSSAINIFFLGVVMHGQELGWTCLGSCSIDVVVNAIALFWVTGGRSSNLPVHQNNLFRSLDPENVTPLPSITNIDIVNIPPSALPSPPGSTRPSTTLPRGLTRFHDYAPTSPRGVAFPMKGTEAEDSPQSMKLKKRIYCSFCSVFRQRPTDLQDQGLQITITTQHSIAVEDIRARTSDALTAAEVVQDVRENKAERSNEPSGSLELDQP